MPIAISFIILHNFIVILLKGKRKVSAAAKREACNKCFVDPVFFIRPIRSWSVSRTWSSGGTDAATWRSHDTHADGQLGLMAGPATGHFGERMQRKHRFEIQHYDFSQLMCDAGKTAGESTGAVEKMR